MLVAAVIAASLLSAGAAQDVAPAATQQASVSCDAGPLEREYGGLSWLVYGCTNGGVIFGGKPGSVAATSLFMWAPSPQGFELTLQTDLGDPTPLAESQAALATMTLADLQALVTEARQVTAP